MTLTWTPVTAALAIGLTTIPLSALALLYVASWSSGHGPADEME